MKYTTEQIEEIAKKLRGLPPVEKKQQELSKFEAIKSLAKEIAAMQKKGYSFEQIADTLKGLNLDITTPTLKSYLQRSKQGTTKRKAQQKPDTTAMAEKTDNADTDSTN